eukprot:11181478-Lingulodinium_polyedra.AAC.1
MARPPHAHAGRRARRRVRGACCSVPFAARLPVRRMTTRAPASGRCRDKAARPARDASVCLSDPGVDPRWRPSA